MTVASYACRHTMKVCGYSESKSAPQPLCGSCDSGEQPLATDIKVCPRESFPVLVPMKRLWSPVLLLLGLSGLGLAFKVLNVEDPEVEVELPEDELEAPVGAVPLFAQLAAAIPLVAINLTNFTGLISDKSAPHNENITYHFGFLESDLAMLSDKVSGYYTVLHEMLGEAGPTLCPRDKQSHIKAGVPKAVCG